MRKVYGSGMMDFRPKGPVLETEGIRQQKAVLELQMRGSFLRQVRDAGGPQAVRMDPVLRSHLGLDFKAK